MPLEILGGSRGLAVVLGLAGAWVWLLAAATPAWAAPDGARPGVGEEGARGTGAGAREAGAAAGESGAAGGESGAAAREGGATAREGGAAPLAKRPRVGVTSVGALGMPSEAVPALLANLSGGLAAAGLRVVSQARVLRVLGGSEALRGCETAVCLRRIGELVRVPLCARATVEATGTSYRLEVVLTEAATGKAAVKLERRCDVCTIKEVNDALSLAAQEAGKQLPGAWRPPLGSVTGDESPAGGSGSGAGGGGGVGPGTGNGTGGGAGPGARGEGPSGSGMTRTQRQMKLWGIITAATSTVGLVPGIALLGLHGKVTDSGCGAKKCIYDSATAGGVLTGLGAAALVAGGALLLYAYLPRKRETQAESGKGGEGPAIRFGGAPLQGGGYLQLEGRF